METWIYRLYRAIYNIVRYTISDGMNHDWIRWSSERKNELWELREHTLTAENQGASTENRHFIELCIISSASRWQWLWCFQRCYHHHRHHHHQCCSLNEQTMHEIAICCTKTWKKSSSRITNLNTKKNSMCKGIWYCIYLWCLCMRL